MSGSTLRQLATAATMIILAACSVGDQVAPTARPTVNKALLANGEVMSGFFSAAPADAPQTTITIKAGSSGVYYFGSHAVYVPANAVCDPATSGYGPSLWQAPCTTLTTDFQVTVKYWTNAQGYPLVEFSPDIRFHPNRSAWLYLNEPGGAQQSTSAILYCPTGSTTCTNESATDSALQTWRDPNSGWLWRMVRHFSGYNVWA